MGWLVLDIRLRGKGSSKEGGSVSLPHSFSVAPLPYGGIFNIGDSRYNAIIAGFFTGGSLAIRGGYKAARNGAIGCAVLLAVIEGVGIGFQRMLAGSTKLEVRISSHPSSVISEGLARC